MNKIKTIADRNYLAFIIKIIGVLKIFSHIFFGFNLCCALLKDITMQLKMRLLV